MICYGLNEFAQKYWNTETLQVSDHFLTITSNKMFFGQGQDNATKTTE